MQLKYYGMVGIKVIFPVSTGADNPKNSLNDSHPVL
jgi:hypothetical protein